MTKHTLKHSIHMETEYNCGEPIILKFELQNLMDSDCGLLIYDNPLEGEVLNFIEIRRKDFIIPYDGRLVKRAEPTKDSYRIIPAGKTIVEKLDLSTSFPIHEPGIYTVTLYTKFLDVISPVNGEIKLPTNKEFEMLTLDPLTTEFKLLSHIKPRLTSGEKARKWEKELLQQKKTTLIDKNKSSVITINPKENQPVPQGIDPDIMKVIEADANARAWISATLLELSEWSQENKNELYVELFGAYSPNNYKVIQDHFNKIKEVLEGIHYYVKPGADCKPNYFAYTYFNSKVVYLCPQFDAAPATGIDSKFGVLIHEWSHAAAQTKDISYGLDNAKQLAISNPAEAILNAANHKYFVEILADNMLTAPIVWPDGKKAYFFCAGEYYQYDIKKDKVDSGYPLPIEHNWPGLWTDRIDAAVVWPNNKVYFFRDSEYMRYDIASKKVDPGYPLPIKNNWPGLWTDRIDAAVVLTNEVALFFKDYTYMRYDIKMDKVDPPTPFSTINDFPGSWSHSINGMVIWPTNKKAYMFKGWRYLRYDLNKTEVDSGYPLFIKNNWPGLPGYIS
ncbi:hypothetical protein IEE86_05005 [Bacillus sp. 28A-2]|uniref:hemopexin repeat-containing protein n=1 Tax=Bacillus sp. 28A-2 TaxID=2772252 RepID=UPI00168CDF3F|nr:hemopexin repeat-containing protein [Bacillus sp. 28A-2]MBD3859088.1 hypothetical protein [Bacillus sp. 28A-2]